MRARRPPRHVKCRRRGGGGALHAQGVTADRPKSEQSSQRRGMRCCRNRDRLRGSLDFSIFGDVVPDNLRWAALFAGMVLLAHRLTLPDRPGGGGDLLKDRAGFDDRPFTTLLDNAREVWVFALSAVNLLNRAPVTRCGPRSSAGLTAWFGSSCSTQASARPCGWPASSSTTPSISRFSGLSRRCRRRWTSCESCRPGQCREIWSTGYSVKNPASACRAQDRRDHRVAWSAATASRRAATGLRS